MVPKGPGVSSSCSETRLLQPLWLGRPWQGPGVFYDKELWGAATLVGGHTFPCTCTEGSFTGAWGFSSP